MAKNAKKRLINYINFRNAIPQKWSKKSKKMGKTNISIHLTVSLTFLLEALYVTIY